MYDPHKASSLGDSGGDPDHYTELTEGHWFARIAEANFYAVGSPNTYLTHTEFPVDEPVWLKPEDVKVGKDTVVEAALHWINQQP